MRSGEERVIDMFEPFAAFKPLFIMHASGLGGAFICICLKRISDQMGGVVFFLIGACKQTKNIGSGQGRATVSPSSKVVFV